MKNGYVKTGKTDMYYISFGAGEKKLIVLPGLSDGLAADSFSWTQGIQMYRLY